MPSARRLIQALGLTLVARLSLPQLLVASAIYSVATEIAYVLRPADVESTVWSVSVLFGALTALAVVVLPEIVLYLAGRRARAKAAQGATIITTAIVVSSKAYLYTCLSFDSRGSGDGEAALVYFVFVPCLQATLALLPCICGLFFRPAPQDHAA